MASTYPSSRNLVFLFCNTILWALIFQVAGHGRLMWPPARGTVFRHQQFAHLGPKPNYGDHGLNCGGRDVQWLQNGGKCGECGDNFQMKRPRPNESGGIYDSNIIVGNYAPGQEIQVHVQLTANHRGFFEFRLCRHNNPGKPEEQSCFDEHLLEICQRNDDGSESRRTWEPVTSGTNQYYMKVKLPEHLTCFQCILQWTYLTGNNWGTICEDSGDLRTCQGVPEKFRGCADIAIGTATTHNEID